MSLIEHYDPTIIAIAALWLVLLIASLVLLWRFDKLRRMAKRQQATCPDAQRPSASIIILAHNQADSLRLHLPRFLAQVYDADFEVIVVDIHSSDETSDVLESLESEYPHLIHTKVPASARDISLSRLALTLGLRAASYEWVVLTRAECVPHDEYWLDTFMQATNHRVDVVLGYTHIECPRAWSGRRNEFFHLWQQMLWMPHADRHRPYRADENLLALRREAFIQRNLFDRSAHLIGGVHSLLLNHNATKGRCAFSLRPASTLLRPQTSRRQWHQDRVFFMEERRAIQYPILYRTLYAAQVGIPRLFGWSSLASALLLCIYVDWRFAVVPVTLWLVVSLLRFVVFHRTARVLGTRSSGPLFWAFEQLIPHWDVWAWLEWRCTQKRTFHKKFV